MRIFIGVLFLINILLIALPIPHITGQSDIIVNNASTLRKIDTDAPAVNLDIQPRIAVQYGNSLRYVTVGSLPAPLQTLLGNVAQRISAQYANNIRHINLALMPDTFQTLLSTIAPRIAFQYANSNRQLSLSYPLALINDSVPPMIGTITSNSSGTNASIIWNTDEFTRYTLRYGTQPGNYTETIEDQLYSKQHTITLSGLVSGGTYYLQITATDLSGNQSISPERSFVVAPTPAPTPIPTPTRQDLIFLPLVER